MFMNDTTKRAGLFLLALMASVLYIANPGSVQGHESDSKGKVKVLYHVDSSDLAVVKYAMVLIAKHIEAEGGPDKIDLKLVVHGPALPLFEDASIDPELKKKLKVVLDKGASAEMCQVSMKLFGTPLEKLVSGFKPTEHPVAVKRIADLQREGYLYIKP